MRRRQWRSRNVVSVQISIVVCTRNRADSLQQCVHALACVETAHEWELVIVDNGSSDGTGAFLSSLPRRINKASVIIAFEPKRGLGTARNKGLNQAHGDIIAFIDDDCYVSKDYIDAMISAFKADSKIGFIGGRILLYDQSDLRMTIIELEDRFVLLPRTFIPAGSIQGANMAFRKSVLERIGGFDDSMGSGTPFPCEDMDAVAAASWAGIAGAYDPRPTVYHHHRRKTQKDGNDLWKIYDTGRGAYYAKYLARHDSRSTYLAAWVRDAGRGMSYGSVRQRLWHTRRTLRELTGAIRYVVTRLNNTKAS